MRKAAEAVCEAVYAAVARLQQPWEHYRWSLVSHRYNPDTAAWTAAALQTEG